VAEQWGLPRYLVESISHSEEDAAESPFQACVQLSGAVADIWLDSDADAARERALQQVHDRLELDSALRPGPGPHQRGPARHRQPVRCRPEFTSRVRELIDHAQELATLRNLRELQDADQARRRADEFEARPSAWPTRPIVTR
jgi:hypothetical protein